MIFTSIILDFKMGSTVAQYCCLTALEAFVQVQPEATSSWSLCIPFVFGSFLWVLKMSPHVKNILKG